MGIWPWNKEWMIKLAGMKYDDDGMLVDDPESKIPLEIWNMPQNTYEFDMDADYNTLSDDLEAVSLKNPAYARIQSSMLMVRPQDPKLVAFIKALGFPNGLPPNIDLSEYSDLLFPDGVVGSARPASPSEYPDFLFDAGLVGGARTASPGLSRSSSSSTISKDSAKDSATVKITPDTPFFPANNEGINPAAVRILSEEEYAKFMAHFAEDAALDTGSTITPA
jgi:hypothetical protein